MLEADLPERALLNTKEEEHAQIAEILENSNIVSRQTAEGLLGEVRFWWTAVGQDYYYSYA